MIDVRLIILARNLQPNAGSGRPGEIHALKSWIKMETSKIAGGNRIDPYAIQTVRGRLKIANDIWMNLRVVQQKILVAGACKIGFLLCRVFRREIVDFFRIEACEISLRGLRKRRSCGEFGPREFSDTGHKKISAKRLFVKENTAPESPGSKEFLVIESVKLPWFNSELDR